MSDLTAIPAPSALQHFGAGALAVGFIAICSCLVLPAEAQTRSLENYLRIAETNSAVLKAQTYQFSALALDSSEVRAAYGPQVNGNGQFLYAPNGARWGYDPAITNGGLYSAVVGAQLPLFNGDRKRTGFDSVAVRGDSLRLANQDTLFELRQRVTDQYINTYADQRTLAAVLDRLRILGSEEAAMKRLVEHGIYQQIDGLNLQVTVQAPGHL